MVCTVSCLSTCGLSCMSISCPHASIAVVGYGDRCVQRAQHGAFMVVVYVVIRIPRP